MTKRLVLAKFAVRVIGIIFRVIGIVRLATKAMHILFLFTGTVPVMMFTLPMALLVDPEALGGYTQTS